MIKENFYHEMIDYTQQIYCSFDPNQPNQAGMILFNKDIKTLIPLSNYTRQQWFEMTDSVRDKQDQPDEPCCSCCTPTAEAFSLALKTFTESGKSVFRIAFVITDGVPSTNNPGGVGSNPLWAYVSNAKGYNPARYIAEDVAKEAKKLKDSGARILLLGVPSSNPLLSFGIDFFTGQGIYNSVPRTYTETRKGLNDNNVKTWSFTYDKPPNPIVSEPIDRNAFSSPTWDVPYLINQTIVGVCEDTFMPTKSPSALPSSFSPSLFPSRVPTMLPTVLPTPDPTKTPTRVPFPVPTPLPTTEEPTSLPTAHPTFTPTEQPTLLPTVEPTLLPVSPSPTSVRPFTQLDVTFIVDRSTSMIWQNAFCNNIVEKLVPWGNIPSTSACWELFMRYILAQCDAIAASLNGFGNVLGWDSEHAEEGFGLRVQVLGFACTNKQMTPQRFEYSDEFMGGQIPLTSRAQLLELLNDLRTHVVPFGGTCPGLTIEQSVMYVERSSAELYPYQSVILLTDGIFFDMPFPHMATKGLDAYRVLKFAVGIAVAKEGGNSFGLSKEEIVRQHHQLSEFVDPYPDNYLDLGSVGWSTLLTDVADRIALRVIQGDDALNGPPALPRYTWCGWRRIANCASNSWRLNACMWVGKKNNKQWACKPRM